MAPLETDHDQDTSAMSTRERVFLGSMGALVLALGTYPFVEKGYTDLILEPDPAEWIGFLLRIGALTALGAIWGYIHRPESDAKRAFQLGMVAPATIAGMIYANDPARITSDQALTGPTSHTAAALPDLSIIGQAHASDGITIVPLPRPAIGPTFIRRVVKGVFGR